MIKLRTRHKDDGRPVAVFGLSRLNVERLTIVFDGRPFGCEGQVVITFGETESVLAARYGLPPLDPTEAEEYVYDPILGMRARKTGRRG